MFFTKLLLHCNGADESVDFPDSSPSNHTVTPQGDAQVDTARQKFGSASVLFDGTGDYLSIPTSDDWDVGGGNFTIDFWFYPTIETRMGLYYGQSSWWGLGIDYHFQGTRNVNIWASSAGVAWDLIDADLGGNGIGLISLNLNAWNHIALVRNGNNWMTFINGVKDVDISVAGVVVDKNETILIGTWFGAPHEYPTTGSIDEFRFSKGIARWTANFTPPTHEYGKPSQIMQII